VSSAPRVRILGACERWGQAEVVRRCAVMLDCGTDDTELVVLLGGEHGRRLVAGGVPDGQAHWLKVWAARGLLWALADAADGDDRPTDALRGALRDGSWRVREMAAKVVARHAIDELLDDVAALESDPVERVRTQATRAVHRMIGGRPSSVWA
jgi:hypothetical protein